MPMSDSAMIAQGDTAIAPDVLEQAAAWFVQLDSESVSAEDRQRWRAWRTASAEHERAWQRAELLGRKFAAIPPRLGIATLQTSKPLGRRRVLQQLAVVLVVGLLSWTGYQLPERAADYRTAIGEIKTITLADGTRLTLNTASAVDIEFSDQQRRVQLRSGEVLIETAPDPAPAHRPFSVATSQGTVTALGTRFTVRENTAKSHVAVLEGRVDIQPAQSAGTGQWLNAGQAADFTATHVTVPQPVNTGAASWAQGFLQADNLPLCDFVAELARYRTGSLTCDPAIARLHISGAFPLADTDRALASLADTLPVTIDKRAGHEVLIRPR